MQRRSIRVRSLGLVVSPFLLALLPVACSSDGGGPGGGAGATVVAGSSNPSAGAAALGAGSAGRAGSPSGPGGAGGAAAGAGGAPVGAGGGAGSSSAGTSAGSAGLAGGTGGNSSSTGGTGGASAGASAGGGASAACPKPAGQVCHEFYANDNSKNQLHYVNEFEPAKSWTIKVGDTGANSSRAIQLVENSKAKNKRAVLVSVDKGYVEYDVDGGAELTRVGGFGSVAGALRVPSDASTKLPAGTTILARDLGTSELDYVDATGKQVAPAAKLAFAAGSEIRLLERNATNGNLTFTKYESDAAAYVYEVNEQGALLTKLKLPAGGKGYNAIWRDGGGVIVATGSLCTIVNLDAQGAVLSTLGGKNKFKDASGAFIFTDFFSGLQRLPNGNFLVANWLGHVTPADHPDTPELLEISAANQLVWSWGNQALATQITNGYVVR